MRTDMFQPRRRAHRYPGGIARSLCAGLAAAAMLTACDTREPKPKVGPGALYASMDVETASTWTALHRQRVWEYRPAST